MFLRVLFLLLLALNLGVAGWLYFAPPPRAAEFAMSDPGIPPLVLVAEREAGSRTVAAAELASAPESRSELSRDHCLSIGPFPTQADMRGAMNKLTPLVERLQFREARATQSRGYWVYLPAMDSREQALGVARQLSAKGVRDYYVVTAGDQQNTISLGLFRDQANAERRRSEIAALGFAPQLIQRTEDLPVYWVDFADDPAHPVNWRSLMPDMVDIREQPVACF
jgi:hypothetical protein